MIGYLKGTVIDVDAKQTLLLVGNVGYSVHIRPDGLNVGDEVELFIHTHVREDDLSLYGFRTKRALKLFELLISVSGVGPKMAMNILAQGTPEQIQTAVATADVKFFTSISGIGKKNSQRIIVDLKSKLGSLEELDLSSDGVIEDELAQALVNMGFDQRQVVKVLAQIDSDLSESERLKQAIYDLSG